MLNSENSKMRILIILLIFFSSTQY